jgi:hypothetical protein
LRRRWCSRFRPVPVCLPPIGRLLVVGMSTPSDAVSTYILAKDGNRPFLTRRAFAEDAELEMVVNTDAISFPSSAKGVTAIEDSIVRRFGLDYENVYTFCLSQPPPANRRHFPCYWLVGMSARSNGQIRIGCGRYDWYFKLGHECHVERLVIAIDVMKVFPACELAASMDWLSRLPYPWCMADEAVRTLPAINGLAEIEAYLKQVRPLSPEQ